MSNHQITPYGYFRSNYRLDKLEDLCVKKIGIQTGPFGSQLHNSDYVLIGTPILTVEHLGENRIIYSDIPKVSNADTDRLSRFLLKKGDIVFSRVGSVDRRALVREAEDGWLYSGRCLRVRPNPELLESTYLSYLMGLPAFKEYIRKIAVGATMPSLNTKILSSIPICYPPLPTQRKIAAILSAYDDLIENNTRRIKILEEMAQNLYREWFVKFRFPGHEHARFVDSPLGRIPEGWEVKKLSEIAKVNKSQIKKNSAPEIIHYIDISSVSQDQINIISTHPFSEAPGRARRIVQHGDIIWSCVRPNRRSHARVIHPQSNTVVSTGFAVLSALTVPFIFLYYSVTTDDFVGYLTNNATGAAYPAVNSGTFEKAELIIPPSDLLERFNEITQVIIEHIHILQCQVNILRTTRDLLLPKLISGVVDVSDINITVPVEVEA